jgi:hypothetical protein
MRTMLFCLYSIANGSSDKYIVSGLGNIHGLCFHITRILKHADMKQKQRQLTSLLSDYMNGKVIFNELIDHSYVAHAGIIYRQVCYCNERIPGQLPRPPMAPVRSNCKGQRDNPRDYPEESSLSVELKLDYITQLLLLTHSCSNRN